MAEILITRTHAEGLRPLGAAAQRNHALITETVATRLSPAHALLFAEPSPTPDGVATDWYAQVVGEVRRLDTLEAEEAERARQRLGALSGDVLGLADELDAGGVAGERRMAEALRNAVEVPDGRALWLVGDQPVLVTWAHCRDTDKVLPGIIRQFIPAKPLPPPSAPPPRPPAVAGEQRSRAPGAILWWLGWLGLGALMTAILWLLIAPCGLKGPGFLALDMCPRSLASTIGVEIDRRQPLEDRITALERDLARTGTACRRGPPPAEDEVDEVLETVLDEGGEIGVINVVLSWQGRSDLDLAVTCPSGERIYYGALNACSGTLDVDANASTPMDQPVENIVFQETPRPGGYVVDVSLYRARDLAAGEEQPFTVTVYIDGEETVRYGSVATQSARWTTTFDYGGS